MSQESFWKSSKKAVIVSIAVDEASDCTDMAELCNYVRFHDGVRFSERLGLISLKGDEVIP